MELLPSKATPRVGWKVGDKQLAPFIWEIKPSWVSAYGKWSHLDFTDCVHPINPEYTDGNSGPSTIRDYDMGSGFRSPPPLPGQEAVEFILHLPKPVLLQPGDEFRLELSAGSKRNSGDGFGRVRFSYQKD